MECETVVMAETSGPKKAQKRKRTSLESVNLSGDEKEAQIGALKDELGALFRYYREVMNKRVDLGGAARHTTVNAMVVALIEERDSSLSELVGQVFAEAKEVCAIEGLNMAAVKTAVLFVGQRIAYGIPNPDADVLEDRSESALWCWETRDLKRIPKSVRQVMNIRRTCRKRIHERITAVSEMIAALQKSEGEQNYQSDLIKASNKLGKTSPEALIRQLIDDLVQKSCVDQAQKEAKREEKLHIKQLDRDKREAEKEKKRLERETMKEKLQSEKEQKRLHEEVEKEERRRLKEESDMRKQLKKQQEEAEKDQRRREKEEAELKKRLSIQKQASMMERFVKRSKTSPLTDCSSTKATTTDSSPKMSEQEAVTRLMDCALLANENMNFEDISKLHLSLWRRLGHSIRSNRKQCWGRRQKPKMELIRQLKLTTTRPLVASIDESDEEKLVDEFGDSISGDRSCQTNASCSLPDLKKFIRRKQLLQFDKSHRPAFYGIWPQKSQVVGPRHPFRKDPELDYEVDSDEEWEEEDPGESLSDCDKEDEDEGLQEEGSKVDDGDESEDGFFVPDGYLSENEGVQVDSVDSDAIAEEAKSTPSVVSEEFCALVRQQKYLNNLTERALKKSQPLIISNLMHEKASLLTAEDLVGTPKLEQMCLQALSMRLFPGSSLVEISLISSGEIDHEVSPPSATSVKDSVTPDKNTNAMSDSDLGTLVSTVQSCAHGINKLAECLQTKLPAFSKSQLRNKVREIAEVTDNRWQVKKEVLQKLGLSTSPEKSSGRTKSIAAFFSKRCLPPADKSINPNEISPQPSLKTSSAVEGQQS